jgi:hypothetical protein
LAHEAKISELSALTDVLAIYNLEDAKIKLMKRYQEIEQHFLQDHE